MKQESKYLLLFIFLILGKSGEGLGLTRMTLAAFGSGVALLEFFDHVTHIGFGINHGHEGVSPNKFTTNKHKFFRRNTEIT